MPVGSSGWQAVHAARVTATSCAACQPRRILQSCHWQSRAVWQAAAALLLALAPAQSPASCSADKDANYAQVKALGDVELGLPTQCIAASKAGLGPRSTPKGRSQYLANVSMKINAKLGGSNVLVGACCWLLSC
jgi:hypothetical protein